MNHALIDHPGTQTYIKELGEGKVEPNPNKVTSFPFSRACVLVPSLPMCSHFGIEAYTYASENGGEGGKWRIRICVPSSLPTFHFVGFLPSFKFRAFRGPDCFI